MHIPKESNTFQDLANATEKNEQVTEGCIEFVEEDVDQTEYRGPKLNFPLTSVDVKNLIELFRKRKENRLHTKYVTRILKEAAGYLKRLPNFNIASTALSKQMTVCGDIHGKLEDLLVVFHKNGLPSKSNPYIFNGDFVDRGKKSLEVFLLLLVTVMAYPGCVFLNRGNHEDSVMNARYGFIREVNSKYKNNGENLMKLIEEVYRWLPLGTLINNKVLVVHGGISDTTNLDTLKQLNRSKYTSILRPPVGENKSVSVNKEEWKQIFDIMWSDPQRNDGCEPNALRSAGTYFGPDITKSFLKRHGLEYIIRSHECKPCGYEIMHSGKVVYMETFLASNYYAVGSNKGAYMKVNPKLDTHFVQFTSESSKTKKLTFRDEVGLVEKTALKELGKVLHEKQMDIEREFKCLDPEDTGIITVTQWCYALEKVTNLGIPWRLLKDQLAPACNATELTGNTIEYKKTLDLLNTDAFMTQSSTTVASSLYNNKSSLEAIFKILDKDNSGYITLDEFGEACDLLAEVMSDHGTKDQVLELCQLMDLNKDGLVDLNEFLEAFRLCEESKTGVKH